jgi:CBS domain containing-hemolysin-like protein
VFIPVDFSQEDILQALRRGRAHIGIVRDHTNARTLGIVTLEDVLESLLGDVREGTLASARLRGA